jgi:hypothetical protein
MRVEQRVAPKENIFALLAPTGISEAPVFLSVFFFCGANKNLLFVS